MNIGKKDVMWGYLSLFLVQGINIILLPFILLFLNTKELGLWYTFSSLYGLAMLIDFGFQATISRNVSYVWSGAKGIKKSGFQDSSNNNKIDKHYFIKLLSSIKSIYYLMGIVIFLLLISIGTLYVYNITLGEVDTKVALISWFFYFIAIVLNIMFSFWNAILRGIGAIKEYNKTLILSKLCQIIFTITFLYFGLGIVGVTLAYLFSVIVNRIILSRYFYKYNKITKQLKGKLRAKLDKKIIKDLMPNTIRTGITSASNYLVINFPIILSSYFISLEVSGQFGIVNQIITLCLTISNSYFNTYLAQFNYYRVKNKLDSLTDLFRKSLLINYAINLVLFLGVILFGNYLLELFTEDKSLLPLPLLLIIITYRFLYNNQTVFVSLLSTRNIIPYYKSFFISALLIVLIQLLTLSVMPSLMGIILPIIIIQMLYNNWYWPLKVIKDLRSQ